MTTPKQQPGPKVCMVEELRVADSTARARAQRVFASPFVLEAGAGTGKTATLVARSVAWCLGPGWQRSASELAGDAPAESGRVAARTLSRVVAITFTEAAAAEMATRVEQALLAVERGGAVRGLDEDALPAAALCVPRAAALRDALDHLVVQTLHAYARRLLAAHPFEAGLHPHLEVDANGSRQRSVVRGVLDARLREAYAAESGDALSLAAAGHGPQELFQELLALLDSGVSAGDLTVDPLAPERIAALLARLRAALEDFHSASQGDLVQATRSKIGVSTAEFVLELLALLREGDTSADTLTQLLAAVEGCEAQRKRLREWSKQSFKKDEVRVLGGRGEAVAAASKRLAPLLAHVADLDTAALARAHRVLAPLLAEVERELDRRGIASFASLLTRAARLLVERPEVAREVRRGIDQLLVDEFQDTDPRQCAIVGALALEGDPSERPGLFLVGDPKQSIYGWRDADLAAYEEFVARAMAAGGERHRLSVNHRSLPAVLAEVERVIAPVMLREEGVQPAFEPLVPSEENSERSFDVGERFAGVEHWITAPWSEEEQSIAVTSASEATRLEARALAMDLCALHEEAGVAWKDVGVLFRSRGDWDVYLSALREHGVSFSVEGDRSYYRRREIIDAAAFVRCVLDRNDHLALVALLRCSAVGVPDAAWIPLWSRGLPERLGGLDRADPDVLAALHSDAEEVAASLPRDIPGLARLAGWERNLVAAAAAIGALRQSFEQDPADVFVEKLRASLLFEATEAARFLGAWRVANLERFFRDLTEELAAGAETQDLLRRLRTAVAEEEEMEEEPPHDAGADAVQILTFHGAKGLDFEHVYLVQLHKGTGQRPGPRVDAARVGAELELRLLGNPSLGFDRVAERRARVADAERVRLLYVGMTRARRRLVLSGAWSGFLHQRRSDTHVSLLEARRDLPDVPAQLAQAGREGRCFVDAAGARFVLPALRADGGPPSGASGPVEDAPPATVQQVAGGAQRIQKLHREAAARMARPLGGRASDPERGPGSEQRAALVSSQALRTSRPSASRSSASRSSASRASASRLSRSGSTESRSPEVARLAGIALHAVFEHLDLALPVREALPRSAEHLEAALRPHAQGEQLAAAVRSARGVLAGLEGGALLDRLERIRHHVIARELPVLLPARDEDEAIAFVSGAIDLVYRDPEDAAWVVVDFKTNAVADARALDAHAADYASQGAVYQRALREALSLPEDPRFELWFLAADRCVEGEPRLAAPPKQMSLTLS